MRRISQNGFVILLAVCLLMGSPALAQSGGPYVLDWSTIDGGGGTSSGGTYTLTGTIGQPEAALVSTSGSAASGRAGHYV